MKLGILIMCLFFVAKSFSQSDPKWDNTKVEKWPKECEEVEIPSTLDGEMQSSFFYSATGNHRPLIVSLHTWSGNYEQKDTLVTECINKDYNYIHPDFRGANNTYKACGSKYVIQDIEDAIAFAIENGKVDINNIHVVGASGGGYATLLTYMNTNHPVKTFSAWVPISPTEPAFPERFGSVRQVACCCPVFSSGVESQPCGYSTTTFLIFPNTPVVSISLACLTIGYPV